MVKIIFNEHLAYGTLINVSHWYEFTPNTKRVGANERPVLFW